MKRISNPPKAKFLMGSMRHMGYSFADAIADVMDNSISANAKTIDLIMFIVLLYIRFWMP